VTLPFLRRTLLSGACAILLAGCGGDDAEPAAGKTAAAPAGVDSSAPSFSTPATPAVPGDSAAAPAPGQAPPPAAVAAVRARDSAMAAQIMDAPVTGPVNVQALGNYQLTMDDVRKLGRAAQNIGALTERRPELRDSLSVGGFDPNAIYERLNSIPEARAAVEQAGMTPRQYVTAMSALMQASLVIGMRERGVTLPAQVPVNQANVEFLEDNREEIQRLMMAVAAQVRPRS
jgi:hypothetical protein